MKKLLNFLIALLLLYLGYLAIIGGGVIDLRWTIPYLLSAKNWLTSLFS